MSYRLNEKPSGTPITSHRAGAWSRQVAAELGSVLLDALGLAATVEWHVHQFQKCTGIVYELTVDDTPDFEVPEAYASSIFDMLHVALNDAARRAQASRVSVALSITPREVTMVMRHNGAGSRSELAQIRKRAQAHNGTCVGIRAVAGAPDEGTTVTVSLPLPAVG